MSYAIRIARLSNFARLVAESLPEDWAGVDAEFNQILAVLDQLNTNLRAITTADGKLQFTQALREMSLIETITATGVAGSSQIVTVPLYDNATDKAAVYVDGVRVLPADVDYTDTTHITITHAFVGGEDIVIDLSSDGAAALVQLASTAVNFGASLVGLHDAGALYAALNAEDAFAEVMTKLNTLITNIGTIADYLKRDGSVTATGNLNMGTHKITGGAAATAATDFVIYSQLTAYTSIWDNLAANFLSLGGGTMSGAIAMGNHQITGVAEPTLAQDAATKNYVDTKLLSVNVPIGGVIAWAFASAPSSDWLIADGSAISRAVYATLNALAAADGYKFGSGDGSTTFNIPDLKGRMILGAGAGSGLTVRTVGDSGGEERHVLSKGEIPAHVHAYHGDAGGPGSGLGIAFTTGTTGNTDDGVAGGIGQGVAGAAVSHNVLNPYKVLTYIIRVK
jgi:microcystin-dependent protein